MEIFSKSKTAVCLFISFVFVASFAFADSSYTVKKGDTLYSISRKYEITVPELRAANNLSETDVLKEGAKLVIPSADISNAAALSTSHKTEESAVTSSKSALSVYVVQKGDTLYGIARKYGIKLPELLSMNNLDNSSTLKVGQKIFVPQKGSEVANVNTSSPSVSKQSSAKPSAPASTSAGVKTTGVLWPLASPVVKNISGKVSGVLLTGKDNEAVKCVREGTVMYTGVYRGFGEVVFVQSKTGLIYSYTGLSSVSAKKGDYILSGTQIGSTGRGSDATMKFMVFQNGMPVDPAKAPRG